jgi:hypothetical protein
MPKGDFNRGEIGSHAGDTPNRRRATDAMEKARAEVIAYLRQGKTPDEAMAAVGRAGKTFYTWMYSSPKFAKMARAAQEAWLAQARQSAMPWREMMDQFDPILRENYDTWTEYQVAHRKAYYNHDTFDHQWRLLEAMEKAPPGGITMILIPPEWTKALAFDTPIPTPGGWKTMGMLQVGDTVFGGDGHPCVVTSKSNVFTDHKCYEVRADDGASVIADAGHLWKVSVERKTPGWKVKTTENLATRRSKRPMIPMSGEVEYPEAELPIDPYVLGVWLGDGNSDGGRISSSEGDMPGTRAHIEAAGYVTTSHRHPQNFGVLGLSAQLRAMHLLGDKHIPSIYLTASRVQRRALLQGLIDTDGGVEPNGRVKFTSTKVDLAFGVQLLARSLGVKAFLTEGRAVLGGRDISAMWTVSFYLERAARMPRKAVNCRNAERRANRYLTVTPVGSVPTQCIAVDSPDHTYLAGHGYMVTHNSTVVLDTIGGDLCDKPNMRFAIVSEGQRLARKMLSRLQGRLAPDDGGITPLVEHFGPFKPAGSSRKPWNADEFTILGATHDEQDPSVLSIGITGAIRGYRWDRVILDDIQSLNNLSQTMTMIEKIRGDIASRPGRTGKLIVLGSRVGRTDVYAELERLEIIDELFIMQALDLTKLAGHQSNFPRQSTPDGAPILDEKGDQMGWNDEDLAQKRRIVGEDQWSRAYMQQPQSDFSALINDQDILNATDPTRSVGQPAGVANMAGEDPSLANHAAFAYCGYDADHLYVLDMVDLFKPTTNQNLFAEIDRGTIKYRPEWWVIEDNTLQSGYLTDDAFINLQKKWGFNAIGHYTGGTKADDKLGVPAMMSAIVRGEIVFPMIGDDHVGFARLFDQLKAWRPDVPSKRLVQDEVMALWFCYLLWRKLREQVNIDVSVWKRSGMAKPTMYPYARTNVKGIEPNPPSRMPMTYEQNWQRLAEEVSV